MNLTLALHAEGISLTHHCVIAIQDRVGSDVKINELDGGVVHHVLRITGRTGSLILKRRERFCFRIPNAQIDPEEISFEAIALEQLGSLVPDLLPRLVAQDRQNHTLVLTDLRNPDLVAGIEYLSSAPYPRLIDSACQIASTLALIHLRSAEAFKGAPIRPDADRAFFERNLFERITYHETPAAHLLSVTNPVDTPTVPVESSSSKPEAAKALDAQPEDLHARIDRLVAELQIKPSRSKLQRLVKEYFEIIKPEPFPSEARVYAIRLLDAGIDVAIKSGIANNSSFALLIRQKASMFSDKDPEQAISILDKGLTVAQASKDDSEIVAEMLGNYASLFWLPPPPKFTPDQSRLVNSALDHRYKELLALANDQSRKIPEAGEQLKTYGAAYEVFGQFDKAIQALEAAERILKASNKEQYYKSDLDDIANRIVRVRAARAGSKRSKSDPNTAEKLGTVEEGRAILDRIEKSASELKAFPARNDIYFSAQMIADKPGGLDSAVEIYRKLLSIDVDALREIFTKSPMTRDQQLAKEQEYSFRDHSFEYLQLLARNALQRPTLSERYVNEALSLLQWRSGEPADALIRSATRAALNATSAGQANELNKTLRKWREVQKSAVVGKMSAVETATALQISIDTAMKLQDQLSATSAVYRKLSGYNTVELSDIRRALRQDEAWIYTMFSQIDGLVVVIVTQKDARIVQKSGSEFDSLPALIASLKSSIANEHIKVDDSKKVYEAIIGPLEPFLVGIKQITIVPERDLLTVPFPALIANKAIDPQSAEWLVQRFAITVVPSARAFIALRARTTPAKNARSFIGFANPVIDQDVGEYLSFSAFGGGAGKKPVNPNLLCPLPTTEDQIVGIARNLEVKDKPVIITGPLMTAPAVQEALAQPVRIVAFATKRSLLETHDRVCVQEDLEKEWVVLQWLGAETFSKI
jgi:tetratricopeptide (TPR) repeat protein